MQLVERRDVADTGGAAVVLAHQIDGAVGVRGDAAEHALGGAGLLEAALRPARLLLFVVHDACAKEVELSVLVDDRDLAKVALVPRLVLAGARPEVQQVLRVAARRKEERGALVAPLEHALGPPREDVVVDLGGADELVVLARRDDELDLELGFAPALQRNEVGAGVDDEHLWFVAGSLGVAMHLAHKRLPVVGGMPPGGLGVPVRRVLTDAVELVGVPVQGGLGLGPAKAVEDEGVPRARRPLDSRRATYGLLLRAGEGEEAVPVDDLGSGSADLVDVDAADAARDANHAVGVSVEAGGVKGCLVGNLEPGGGGDCGVRFELDVGRRRDVEGHVVQAVHALDRRLAAVFPRDAATDSGDVGAVHVLEVAPGDD